MKLWDLSNTNNWEDWNSDCIPSHTPPCDFFFSRVSLFQTEHYQVTFLPCRLFWTAAVLWSNYSHKHRITDDVVALHLYLVWFVTAVLCCAWPLINFRYRLWSFPSYRLSSLCCSTSVSTVFVSLLGLPLLLRWPILASPFLLVLVWPPSRACLPSRPNVEQGIRPTLA